MRAAAGGIAAKVGPKVDEAVEERTKDWLGGWLPGREEEAGGDGARHAQLQPVATRTSWCGAADCSAFEEKRKAKTLRGKGREGRASERPLY